MDDGLTSVWTLMLIWILISVFSYQKPPPVQKRNDFVGNQSEDDSFLDTIMWLNQHD